ncbi:hypothetical protein TIFTF001_034491 [Ficus carica]|uniref:Uncharacterized protein n=1 Tax=Ficus carica TaxID=3494 RepID=A0AA88E0L4_FICCA|nr:hypothetical protein TIFTF001_034491 [Ficus carica]
MYICVHTGRTESQLIDSIVGDVINKLNGKSVASRKLRGLVGIVERIKEVEQLLQIGSLNKLGPIGIWGPGGIGIPLALKVLGRHLLSRDIEAWESALNKLERFPDKKIERVLRISYDALDDTEKEIFIDIALFLNGENRDVVQEILDDLYATDGIGVLIDKALITIGPLNTVEMHSLLQVMASQIVRPHSTNQDPRKGSRLTDAEDIYQALENDRGLETIEGISLDTSTCNREISFSPTTFSKMRRLRLLKISGGKLCLPQDHPLAFPWKLKYLNWDACPSKSLSTNFIAEMLVVLDMRGSRLEKLWEGAPNLDKLKRINLSGSKHLTQLPDLSQAPNIEIVNCNSCVHLTEVPSYVRHLNKLKDLSLRGCTSLCKLSELPKNLRSLDVLTRPAEHDTTCCRVGENCEDWFPSLNFSSKLETFPIISEPMELLTHLKLDFAAIEELPPSIENLTGLKSLSLSFCAKLKFLPDSIYSLTTLSFLDISFCRKLESLPVLPLSLGSLIARCCTSLKTVSSSIPSVKQNWNHLYYRRPSEHFEFLGCEMLDENARKVLMEEALLRILRFATIFSKYRRSRFPLEKNRSYWPGSEILRWFSHKSEGSSICINLPHPDHQWYNSSYLGLAFCLIIEFKDLLLSPLWSMLHVESTYTFPNGDSWRQRRNLYFAISYSYGESFHNRCYQFPYKETGEKNLNGSLNSEYVFVFMDNTYGEFLTFDFREEYSEKFGEYIKAEEGRFNNEIAACTTSTATASFSFSLDEEYQNLAKINKCGVHLLYSQEAERFGYVSKSSGDDYNGGGESDSSGREAIHSESDDQEEDHCEPLPKRFRT